MNRAIVRLDEGTVNYIVGQFIFNSLPEEIINSNKFRMEVMRYKNKDVRIVVKTDAASTIHAVINSIESESEAHNV